MLSYAGVTLPCLSPENCQAIETRIRLDSINPYDTKIAAAGVDGFGEAARDWGPLCRPIRLGRLNWPTGASRWASFFLPVSQAQIESIRSVVYDPQLGYIPANLVIEDGVRSQTALMFMLPPRPISNGLWLLPLVDQRYWWWKFRTGNLTANGSWNLLYTDIANILGITITPDTVNSNYFSPPSTLPVLDVFVPPLLDYVAKCVGQRVVVLLNGTVVTVNSGTAALAQIDNLNPNTSLLPPLPPLLGGGQLLLAGVTDTEAILPKTVRVDFPVSASSVHSESVLVGSLSGFSTFPNTGFTTVLQLTLPSGTSSYSTVAAQYAFDYCNWLLSPVEAHYAGIAQWPPTGLEDWIEWTYLQDQCSTRIARCMWESSDPVLQSTGQYLSATISTASLSTSWTATGLSVTLPANSTWFLQAQISGLITSSSSGLGDDLQCRFNDGSAPQGEPVVFCYAVCDSITFRAAASLTLIYTVGASAVTMDVQGIVSTTTGSTGSLGAGYLAAIRLA